MSNLTRLQAVSSSLDTAITKAENLPDAGSGSGEGSVETCTVTIDFSVMENVSSSLKSYIYRYAFATYVDGEIGMAASMGSSSAALKTLTVNNVVCGSIFYVCYTEPISVMSFSWNATNGIELLSTSNTDVLITAKAPITANTTGAIVLEHSGDEGPELA